MKTDSKNYQARLFEVEVMTLTNFCKANPTEVTQQILKLIQQKDWSGLLKVKVNPSSYEAHEVDLFRVDYQASSMLSKSFNLPLSVDKRQAALIKFESAEQQCDATNFRLLSWGHNPKDAPWLIDVVAKAQHIIRQVLGPLDKEALTYVDTHCRFGPGATGTIKRRTTQGRKYDNPRPSASPRLAAFMKDAAPALWADRLVKVECCSFIGITTVAKNAKTDRTIGIEPDLNIYVQLGIGALIRNRLTQFGLNLQKQADRNAYLASKAHVLGLSTIDLSSASDCVSRALVELLLPEEWRHLLWLARSDYYELEGKIHPFSKWSSMGNGYTFELETLIFMALARACGDNRAVAYGDDIIVSRACAPLLLSTLDFLGFSVNSEKTFIDGLFFESCGSDWFNGVNVRPFFLKGEIDLDQPDTKSQYLACLFTYANQISAVAHRSNCGLGRDYRYFSSWRSCYQAAPPSDRIRIPTGFNTSGGFESDWDECNTLLSAQSFKYLRFCPARGRVKGDWGPYLAWQSSAGRRRPTSERVRLQSLREEALVLADQELKTDSYHRDGESYRYEGSYEVQVGTCFAWPNRGPWQ